MPNTLFQARTWLSYWLNAVDQHSLHSPFFFDFYKNVVKAEDSEVAIAEKLRNQLLTDQRTVNVDDPGSGQGRKSQRLIRDIASSSLSTKKFSGLYKRIIEHYGCKTIVELGTSFGINTLYLGAAAGSKVHTFEGSDAIAEIASLTFHCAEARNITIVKGNIDSTLPSHLSLIKKIDFVFIDANHTYKATTGYFQKILQKIHDKSIVIIDDIHYSSEMEKAWNEIRKNDLVYGAVDLYRCGILFFDPSLNKQHVILQF